MTEGKVHDVNAARQFINIEPDSIYCADKGYMSLAWLKHIDDSKAFFVTRLRNNSDIAITGQHSQPRPKQGILEDNIIEFCNPGSYEKYPKSMRAVEFHDEETGKTYVFITNNFKLSAITIAAIYKQRWQIELFFKWIKQNLKIKTFFGTSRNAVMTQIWAAMIYYLLLSYIKFMSKIKFTITEISRRIKEGLMSRFNLLELLSISRQNITKPPDWNKISRQPDLFGFNF